MLLALATALGPRRRVNPVFICVCAVCVCVLSVRARVYVCLSVCVWFLCRAGVFKSYVGVAPVLVAPAPC